MTVESAADRLIMLADFGESCTSGSVAFTAIFDNEYIDVGQGNVSLETSTPMLTARTADVSTLAHDATIKRSGISYKLRGIHPDGTGITTLILEVI